MLNISKANVSKKITAVGYSTLVEVEEKVSKNALKQLMYGTTIVFIIIMFLPWTQNLRTSGYVTTLKPNQKPQSVNTVLAGQVEYWYVQEGDFVKKGDTILKITEIKDAYFDENLLNRTKNQVDLKSQSILTYTDKINNQEAQLVILKNQRDLKISQSENKLKQAVLKLQIDSISFETANLDLRIANRQLKRTDSLYKMGLKSLTDVETKRIKQQKAEGYKIKTENTWLNSKTNLINLKIEIANVVVKYNADYNKIISSKLSTELNKMDTESGLNKLENQYSNYEFRQDLYYIIAPQNGYITKVTVGGIGETLKEGEEILTLMPEIYDLAVEIYIAPVDLPLIKYGQKVRLQFDGWPAIVFSGWPNASHGTYGGEIYGIDQFISPNGKYRVLVKPDEDDYPWPDALRFGGGTSSMIMLNDVSIWYEVWRNINGFPPDFYKKEGKKKEDKK